MIHFSIGFVVAGIVLLISSMLIWALDDNTEAALRLGLCSLVLFFIAVVLSLVGL